MPNRVIRPARIVHNRDMTCDHVGQVSEHPEWKQFAQSMLTPLRDIETSILLRAAGGGFDFRKLAIDHLSTENYAESIRLQPRRLNGSVGQSHIRCGESKLDLASHHFQAFPRPNVELRIKICDLSPNSNRIATCIKKRDGPYSAAPFAQRFPIRLTTDASRADDPEARDHNFAGSI